MNFNDLSNIIDSFPHGSFLTYYIDCPYCRFCIFDIMSIWKDDWMRKKLRIMKEIFHVDEQVFYKLDIFIYVDCDVFSNCVDIDLFETKKV